MLLTGILQQPQGEISYNHFRKKIIRYQTSFPPSRQRSVCISAHAGTFPSPIVVRDFNSYNVTRYKNQESDDTAHKPCENTKRLVTEETLLEPPDVFAEDVWSALPYIEVVSRQLYDYTAVLIDEEGILGLQVLCHLRWLDYH
jgi:hypothetical protein